MLSTSEMSVNSNNLSQELIKQWLTELTCYTPQQVDNAIAQIQQRAEVTQQD